MFMHVIVFIMKEYKARHEERVKRFGELTGSESVVNADTINDLYTGQVA